MNTKTQMPSDAEIDAAVASFDWDGWTESANAQRAFVRECLLRFGTATQPKHNKLTAKLTSALIGLRDIGALEDGLLGDDSEVIKAQEQGRAALNEVLMRGDAA